MPRLSKHAQDLINDKSLNRLSLIEEFREARGLDDEFDRELKNAFLDAHDAYFRSHLYAHFEKKNTRRVDRADFLALTLSAESKNRKERRLTGRQRSAIKIEYPDFYASLHSSLEHEEEAKIGGYVGAIRLTESRIPTDNTGRLASTFAPGDFAFLRSYLSTDTWVEELLSGVRHSSDQLSKHEATLVREWSIPFLITIYSLME